MIPSIVDKMYSRLKARHQLYREVLALEQQIYGNGGAKNLASSQSTTCILAQWSPITFAEYMERILATGRFIDENLVTANHLLYHAVLIRGSAKMECFVSVSPNFPNECPIWAIILNFNGRLYPSNSNDIKVGWFFVPFNHWKTLNFYSTPPTCLGNGILDQFIGIIQKDDWKCSDDTIEACHVFVGHLFGNRVDTIVFSHNIGNGTQIGKNILESVSGSNTIQTIQNHSKW